MIKARVKTTTRIIGVVALAKELGVTREHLYRVVKGERESRRLTSELKKRGIKCRKAI
jgi:DNA-binding phage protein